MGEGRTSWLCACALALAGCAGGTDTGNPLTEREIGSCKSEHNESALSVARSALTGGDDPARYDGLTCLRAERSDEQAPVQLDVYNFSAGCSIEWDAKARAH